MGDKMCVASDPLDTNISKYLEVPRSDYLYTPRSLFWPDVISLLAPKLDWRQAVCMAISVQRIVSMDSQEMIITGSNDHIQSRGLLARLTDGSVPSNEVMGEAIMTLFLAMTELEIAVLQHFTKNAVKIVCVLSSGYAGLPEPLQFVYTIVTTTAEGRFDILFPLIFLLSARTFRTPSRDLRSIA